MLIAIEGSTNYIPSTSLGIEDEDEKTGERFTVPCEPRFSVPSLPLGRVDNIERYLGNFSLDILLFDQSIKGVIMYRQFSPRKRSTNHPPDIS